MSQNHCLKPIVRNSKNFIYKGEKYPINFDLIKSNSNYFYKNSDNFVDENIELHEEIDISTDVIKTFIDICQNKSFTVNDSNVFQLDYLSQKYEIPGLSEITHEYIGRPNTNLAFQLLLFKTQNQNNINSPSRGEIKINDTSNEEKIISSRLIEYLEDDRLVRLSIPIIDRILKNYLNENKGQINSEKINEFLFKCLDVHKREASVLFLNIDINNQPIGVIGRLIKDYSEIFDFNMINNKSILKTSSDLLKELIQVKNEFNEKISDLNKIIKEQKNEIKQFNESRNLIENDLKNLIQKQNNIIEEQNKIINELKSTTISQQIQNEIMNQSNNYVTKEILMKLCLSNLIIYLNVVSILLYINKILCVSFYNIFVFIFLGCFIYNFNFVLIYNFL